MVTVLANPTCNVVAMLAARVIGSRMESLGRNEPIAVAIAAIDSILCRKLELGKLESVKLQIR